MMKLKTKNVLLALVILALAIGTLLLVIQNGKSKKQSNQNTIEIADIAEKAVMSDDVVPNDNNPEGSDPPSQEITMGGWIAYWDLNGALSTYKANSSVITSLSPTWYFQQPDGTLGLKNTARNSEVRNLCTTNETMLIPSISNSNADSLSAVLNNQDLLTKHVSAIVGEVITYDYDGIDIDYEAIKDSDKEAFTGFIKLLSEELHSKNKLLTIAILWKNDLDTIISAVSESRAAQDWQELGKYVDEFRIMAYDFTGSSDPAGPIAPYDWIRSIIDYATKNVDTEKIVLALPLYAYEWYEGKPGAKALVWNDVQNKQAIISDVFDDSFKEKRITFTLDNNTKIIWYQDAEATEKRIELAKTYGIFKFYFWRLGGEDPDIYKIQ